MTTVIPTASFFARINTYGIDDPRTQQALLRMAGNAPRLIAGLDEQGIHPRNQVTREIIRGGILTPAGLWVRDIKGSGVEKGSSSGYAVDIRMPRTQINSSDAQGEEIGEARYPNTVETYTAPYIIVGAVGDPRVVAFAEAIVLAFDEAGGAESVELPKNPQRQGWDYLADLTYKVNLRADFQPARRVINESLFEDAHGAGQLPSDFALTMHGLKFAANHSSGNPFTVTLLPMGT